jgi:hypothetical protein
MTDEIFKLTVFKLVKTLPNDQELGETIRKLYYKINKYETNTDESKPTTDANSN